MKIYPCLGGQMITDADNVTRPALKCGALHSYYNTVTKTTVYSCRYDNLKQTGTWPIIADITNAGCVNGEEIEA
jgi:hypothetical protein